jgi:tripartite-type tricarboxylate transporter receptor subunit TctC
MKSLLPKIIAALVLGGPIAVAAQYPERPISFVVPFAAGGATDALARQFAERMARTAKQTIIVENVAGAGGTVGAARVAKARPDGYTYLIGHVGYMAAATGMYKQLPYDPVQDFDAVARFPDTPMVLVCGRNGRFANIRGHLVSDRRGESRKGKRRLVTSAFQEVGPKADGGHHEGQNQQEEERAVQL